LKNLIKHIVFLRLLQVGILKNKTQTDNDE